MGGAPPFVESAQGAWLIDADGNRYIDYFGSWGPMILGHAFPPVVEAIERAARNSASFGASTAAEADLAERVVACYPAIEKLRFVSSGTEATMPQFVWPALPPAAKSLSNSKAATTATPTAFWSKPAPASPPSAFPAQPAYPRRLPASRSRCPTTISKLLKPPSPLIPVPLQPSSWSRSSAMQAALRPLPGYLAGLPKSPPAKARCSSPTKS